MDIKEYVFYIPSLDILEVIKSIHDLSKFKSNSFRLLNHSTEEFFDGHLIGEL